MPIKLYFFDNIPRRLIRNQTVSKHIDLSVTCIGSNGRFRSSSKNMIFFLDDTFVFLHSKVDCQLTIYYGCHWKRGYWLISTLVAMSLSLRSHYNFQVCFQCMLWSWYLANDMQFYIISNS